MSNSKKLNLKNFQLVGIVKETINYYFGLCPFHNDTIPSLAIHKTGDRAGQWICRGCGAYGTLTNSEMQKLGCSKSKQIKRKSSEDYEKLLLFYQSQLNKQFGVEISLANNTRLNFPEKQEYRLKDLSKDLNISIQTLRKSGVGWYNNKFVWPMRNSVGGIVGLHTRDKIINGTKRNIAGSELGLFYDYPVKPQSQLFITEGLTDYLTLSDWGFWAVSVASATINPQIIVDFYLTYLPKFVIIISDNDNAGLKLSYDLQHKFDKYVSTSLVIPPKLYKDLRCWKQKGSLTKEQFQKLVEI